jgi:hypothetical protein
MSDLILFILFIPASVSLFFFTRFLRTYFRGIPAILLMEVKVEFLFKCHSRAGLPAARQLAGIYIKRPFYRFRVKHGMTI